MPKATLFHNPRCSKSRDALSFLNEKAPHLELEVVEYLKQAPSKETLATLFTALNISSAHDMIRPKEAEFKLANLNASSSNKLVLDAIATYPKLLERPILLINEKAAIGRPIENIEALVNA